MDRSSGYLPQLLLYYKFEAGLERIGVLPASPDSRKKLEWPVRNHTVQDCKFNFGFFFPSFLACLSERETSVQGFLLTGLVFSRPELRFF